MSRELAKNVDDIGFSCRASTGTVCSTSDWIDVFDSDPLSTRVRYAERPCIWRC